MKLLKSFEVGERMKENDDEDESNQGTLSAYTEMPQ
jgi:hypothetical protein